MCGIAGIIDDRLGAEKGQQVLHEMLNSMHHRGPDARGMDTIDSTVFLGHNRLSIIDLTDDSNQPMVRQHLSLTFNGEIYNYIEIKKELTSLGAQFRTNSDTEVIIEAYKKWGEKCVEKFVGMWAFAIWNSETRELFCSRDRFGIKPFYYIYDNDKFYFASEIKALKSSPIFSNELDENHLIKALHLGPFGAGHRTHFSKIKSLPLAHNAMLSNGDLEISRYWDIDFGVQSEIESQTDRIDRFKELFEDSIRLHMRSDVEVGGCLSGGIDSGSIASIVGSKYADVDFKTFNIYYEGEGKSDVDERPWVNDITQKYPSLSPYFLSPSEKDVADEFERFAYHQDFPVSGSSPLSGYFVMKLAASHGIKVLLNGQGADEYLAGYMHAFYRFIGSSMSEGRMIESIRRLNQHAQLQELNFAEKMSLFAKSIYAAGSTEQDMAIGQLKRKFAYLSANVAPERLIDYPMKSKNKFSDYLYHATFSSTLPTLLHYEDRNSMAFSIESRVPFLDHRLVEFAYALTDTDKINNGMTKYILRKAMSDYLPPSIANRRDKKGFVTPGEVRWLRGPLKHLTDIEPKDLYMLDESKTRKVLEAYRKGDNRNAKLVWRLATLNHWMKTNKLN